MAENKNFSSIEAEEKQENKRLASTVVGGIAIAVIIGLFVTNILNLGIARYRVDQLTAQVEELEEKNKNLKSELGDTQLENVTLKHDLKKVQTDLDTRNDEIEVYEETLDEVQKCSDEINTYIDDIKDILREAAAYEE